MPLTDWRSTISLRGALTTIAVMTILALVGTNIGLGRWSVAQPRLTSDFSRPFLLHRIRDLARKPPQILVFGDSVLWGYRVQPDQLTTTFIERQGLPVANFAFKGSSPPNYYALLHVLQREGVHPKFVLLEINQKVFNPADTAYAVLHPGLEAATPRLLSASDKAHLRLKLKPTDPALRLARLEDAVLMYGMRADIRNTISPEEDPAPPEHPDPDFYAGAFDLSPLDESNTGVYFLRKLTAELHRGNIPFGVLFTPTNHSVLHDYIDSLEYEVRKSYIANIVRADGAAILDIDKAFPGELFMDEVHVTPAGHQKLADILIRFLKEHVPR